MAPNTPPVVDDPHDPAFPSMCISSFLWGSPLGQGSFSRVLHARHKCGHDCAIKATPLPPTRSRSSRLLRGTEHARRERNALVEISLGLGRNPSGVVRLHASFYDRHHLYLVLNLMEGVGVSISDASASTTLRTLNDYVKFVWSENNANHIDYEVGRIRRIFGRLVDIVGGMHLFLSQTVKGKVNTASENNQYSERCVIHGDIKPSNIMFDSNGNVNFVDFGSSTVLFGVAELRQRMESLHRKCSNANKQEEKRSDDMEGTIGYMAPEIITGNLSYLRDELSSFDGTCYASFVTPAADLWSLGCVLHLLLTGRTPFSGTDRNQEPDQVVIGRILEYAARKDRRVSETEESTEQSLILAGLDLASLLMAPDPSKRLGWEDLKTSLLAFQYGRYPDVPCRTDVVSGEMSINRIHFYKSIAAHPFFNGHTWDGSTDKTDFFRLDPHQMLSNISNDELHDGDDPRVLDFILLES